MLRNYNINVGRIKQLPHGTRNANLLLETNAGKKVLRVYLHKSMQETALDREALSQLAKSPFPSPRLLKTSKGRLPSFHGHPVVVYDWIVGNMASSKDPSRLEEVGAWMGFLHKTLSRLQAPKSFHGIWDYPRILSLTRFWRPRLIRMGYPHAQELFTFIQDELGLIKWPQHLPTGFTHQDIKPENVLAQGGRVTVILDFDNAYIGELINDLTTTMLWWCTPNDRLDPKRVRRFLKGYERERTFTSTERAIVLGDAFRFRMLRELLIWPMRCYHKPDIAEKHVRRLLRLYQNAYKKRPAFV